MAWEVFDAHAGEYDTWFDAHRDEFLAELARVREAVPPGLSPSAEVGAGSGRFAAALGVDLGVEPSRALARMARARGIQVVRGTGEALPLRSSSLALVLLVTVDCFLDDPHRALRECHRALSPGGLLVLAFIERGGPIHERYLHAPGKHRFLSRARFYAREEVLAMVTGAGFRAERVDPRAGFCVLSARRV
ncbi:MAG: methyltransferase domain-containing protein [Methanolinea sp.]|nr:methyltransferase domain-containing protein [Methanolinea sp.]